MFSLWRAAWLVRHMKERRKPDPMPSTTRNIATDGVPTDFVEALRAGSREAVDMMVSLLYGELRQIAHRHLAGSHNGATLNTTALVNEAYLKLVDQSRAGGTTECISWRSLQLRCATY
jgi:hypothetical protein